MPKEETRAVKRIPLYEEKTSGKTYVSAEVAPQQIGAALERLQHQIWAKNGETIRVFDKSLVLHGETLLHAAKRIWQNATPDDFNADDRYQMLGALKAAIAGRHGQVIENDWNFDARASVPNWQKINLQTMKSNQYGALIIWNQPEQATTTQETPP